MNSNIQKGYKESAVGVIPADWEVKRLGEVLSRLSNGLTYNTELKKGIPVTRIETISSGSIDFNKVGFASDIKTLENYRLQKGDILFSHINSIAHIGKVAIYNSDNILYHGMNLLLLRSNDLVNANYLYYYLCSSLANKQMRMMAKQAVNQASINVSELQKSSFPVPPLREQERIAEVLGCWDEGIQRQAKMVELLTQRKRALMQQLLTAKKRLQNFSTPWQTTKLGEIGSTYNGLTGKSKDDFGSGSKYITYTNIFKASKIDIRILEHVKVLKNETQNMVKYGDIFFTVSSETPEEVGMSSVLLDNLQNTYLNSFCFGYRLNDFNALFPEFAQYYLRGKNFRLDIIKLAQGSTRFNLSKGEVLKINLTIPSLEEQKAIAEVLTTADKEIDIATKQLVALRHQKRALMQQLLTGKKRLKF